MFRRILGLSLLVSSLVAATPHLLAAAECQLQIEQKSTLPEELSAEMAAAMAPPMIQLQLDEEPFCDVWLAKHWQSAAADKAADADAKSDYSLAPGTLIGVIRLAGDCRDLRDQFIPAGVYTLRYAMQPEIEAHKGTHDSRHFLLLLSAATDQKPEIIADDNKLIGLSGEAIGELHPAFLPLAKIKQPCGGESVRPDPLDPAGWILRVSGSDKAGKCIPLEMILPALDY